MTKRLSLKLGTSFGCKSIVASGRGIRFAATTIGFVVALPGGSLSETALGLWGIWHGKINGAEIYLCIQSDPAIAPYDNFAAIYATADNLIELLERDERDRKSWTTRNDEKVAATLSILGDGSLILDRTEVDLWSGIKLAPLPFAKSKDTITPCESTEFNLPRAVIPPLQVTARNLGGVPYDVITLVDPAGHGEVSTFQLQSDQHGTERINKWLKAFLPTTAEAAPYYTCSVDALGDGFTSIWTQRIFPEMISDRFIVAGDTAEVFCGGSYADSLTKWYVFDNQTGAIIDTHTWVHPDAFNLLGPNAGLGTEIGYPEIETGFRDLIMAAFAATNPDNNCRDFLEDVSIWNIRPSKTGLILSPEVPHALKACAEDLVLDHAMVTPYLTESFLKYRK
jgi:hypothetical protein